jgi:hypothetical protein
MSCGLQEKSCFGYEIKNILTKNVTLLWISFIYYFREALNLGGFCLRILAYE